MPNDPTAPAVDATADAANTLIDRAASTSAAIVDKTADAAKAAERTVREQGRHALDVGHNVVRAGIGAAGAVQEQAGRLFDSLVHRGARTEGSTVDDARSQVADARATVESRAQQVASTVSEKVAGVVDSAVTKPLNAAMHRVGVPTRAEVGELAASVAALAGKVDQLIARLDAAPVVFAAEEAVIVAPDGTPAHLAAAEESSTDAADAEPSRRGR